MPLQLLLPFSSPLFQNWHEKSRHRSVDSKLPDRATAAHLP
nr:MAG TPA: hypothetical protein [Caudoviricetes sp.]DAM88005.1 MAG TPA: hypothetical protein [Caudoviricetes sp.]